LTKTVFPGTVGFGDIRNRIGKEGTSQLWKPEIALGWTAFLGWAVSLIFYGGLIWLSHRTISLLSDIEVVSQKMCHGTAD